MEQLFTEVLTALEGTTRESRVEAARAARDRFPELTDDTHLGDEVNNHVHTIYSFSPYSPTQVVAAARLSGLRAVGSIDHDSIAAAGELLETGRILRLATTVGFELRVSWTGTPFETKRLNNPDTPGNAYVLVHGVAARDIPTFERLLAPVRTARRRRNAEQVDRLNRRLRIAGIETLRYADDVEPLSQVADGGTVTERHILFALALKLIDMWGRGPVLVENLKKTFDISCSSTLAGRLSDPENPHYTYDLLGALKSELVPSFFVEPDEEECMPVGAFLAAVGETSAIPAYAYLGDVGASPTGDKKAQQFEDAYLDELFEYVAGIGFQAVTYMPPRNTRAQLMRVGALARSLGLMEISGVDINSSRQSFNCPEVLDPDFRHLVEATWALIAHEKLSELDATYGLFHSDSPFTDLSQAERIARYAAVGRAINPADPSAIDLNRKRIRIEGKEIT